jgi:hypothetical protein
MERRLSLLDHLQFLQKKVIIVAVCMMSFNSLPAAWDPDCIGIDQNVLEDQNFKSLKENVVESLKNTWCSAEKANLLMDLIYMIKPKVCVEIGAFTGSSVLPVAATLKHLGKGKIYAIDAWSNDVVIRNLEMNDPNRTWWAGLDMNNVYSAFQHLMDHWSLLDFCEVMCKPSEEAAVYVKNIDFLHLDGDYSEIGSRKDVDIYLPKVKSGGYILLSNLLVTINGKQPKSKAFSTLYDACEMICEIERNNAILFRKN